MSFESSIKGTRNLIDFIASSHAHLFFCSSLASVLAGPSPITESPSTDASTASSVGYSQSKWVTERICAMANDGGMDGRVHVLRIGQLCGDTVEGYWNEKEGWPLLIRTANTTGVLPELGEVSNMLPAYRLSPPPLLRVTKELRAETILAPCRPCRASHVSDPHDESKVNPNRSIDVVLLAPPRSFIYHIAHPSLISWSTILDGLSTANLEFRRVQPAEWLDAVDNTPEEDASRQMLDLWKGAYSQPSTVDAPEVKCENAVRDSPTLRDIGKVGEEQVGRMVQAWRKSGFLH